MKPLAPLCILGLLFSSTALAALDCKAYRPDLVRAKNSFATNCVSCHGVNGDGNGPAGQYLVPKPRNFAVDDFRVGGKKPTIAQIVGVITNGLPGTAMVPFSGQIKDEKERCDLAHYVLTFRKK
ncbi:MAG: c-type cytochrome [Oligoflexia bacterium]|nr:c-type cytochrome [Oligoflexia bacterium]